MGMTGSGDMIGSGFLRAAGGGRRSRFSDTLST